MAKMRESHANCVRLESFHFKYFYTGYMNFNYMAVLQIVLFLKEKKNN